MSSNGTMPSHSCSPVQPGTGNQPLERGRFGTNARTRWPILPDVSPATTLWSIIPNPRVSVWYMACGSEPFLNLPVANRSEVGSDPGSSCVP